jgi:fumarylacetoacetate (FAA) hydrolase
MKLASLKDGRDGRLVVVSDDLTRCAEAPVATLQAALDDWDKWAPRLAELKPDAPFDPARCAAPLPRAHQFLDGSAYVNHVELVRRARGAEMPERFWSDPLMYQGASAPFLAPTDPIAGRRDWGMDFEAEIAIVTGDVPRGADRKAAARAIRLVMLCNDVSLRGLIPDELSKGFGFVQSKPPSSFAPVAVTPDAVPGWDGARLHGQVSLELDGALFGRPDAGRDMTFDFPDLIAHAARTRPLGAGTIIGAGTVSNKEAGGPGRKVADGGAGYACIAEQRTVEALQDGRATTPFLRRGNRVRIWMDGPDGAPIFGIIDQQVEELE